jgi:hypothetical protein
VVTWVVLAAANFAGKFQSKSMIGDKAFTIKTGSSTKSP